MSREYALFKTLAMMSATLIIGSLLPHMLLMGGLWAAFAIVVALLFWLTLWLDTLSIEKETKRIREEVEREIERRRRAKFEGSEQKTSQDDS